MRSFGEFPETVKQTVWQEQTEDFVIRQTGKEYNLKKTDELLSKTADWQSLQ